MNGTNKEECTTELLNPHLPWKKKTQSYPCLAHVISVCMYVCVCVCIYKFVYNYTFLGEANLKVGILEHTLDLTLFIYFLPFNTSASEKSQNSRHNQLLYTPYISRGFYFREFRESGAISRIYQHAKIFTSDPVAWMRLVYAIHCSPWSRI